MKAVLLDGSKKLQIVKAPSFFPKKCQLSAHQWLLCWPDGGGSSNLDDVNYTQTPKQLMSKPTLRMPQNGLLSIWEQHSSKTVFCVR